MSAIGIKGSLTLFALIALGAIVEFAAYFANRALGDYVYLGISALFAVLVIWICCKHPSWCLATIFALILSAIIEISNSYFADFIRNSYLDLGEDYGHSALRGIVIYLVILPSVFFACVLTMMLQPFVTRRS